MKPLKYTAKNYETINREADEILEIWDNMRTDPNYKEKRDPIISYLRVKRYLRLGISKYQMIDIVEETWLYYFENFHLQQRVWNVFCKECDKVLKGGSNGTS